MIIVAFVCLLPELCELISVALQCFDCLAAIPSDFCDTLGRVKSEEGGSGGPIVVTHGYVKSSFKRC